MRPLSPSIRPLPLAAAAAGAIALAGLWLPTPLPAADHPTWGRDGSRNMVSPETGLPTDFAPGTAKPGSEEIDPATTRTVKWVAKLGSQSYGNPTVAGGRVFVGTNNESPRDPKFTGDRSTLYCFDEATGAFLWQFIVPKLGAGKVSDWEFLGICSSPAVEGDRLWIVTNRCEVVCLDVKGLADGNDGPFQDEDQYAAGPGQPKIAVGAKDADIVWRLDMREECGVFPHNIASSSILVAGDRLYVTTSNGQDWSHLNVPAPNAPCLICVDKRTGKLLGEEHSGIGFRLLHCNWSSPAFAAGVGERGQVIFGAGDGWVYGYDPVPVAGEEGFDVLPEAWRFDLNPPERKVGKEGKPIKYPAADGPSEVIATPVVWKGRVYAAVGQDPEHGEGVGILSCIDPTKRGDVTKTGRIWSYDKIARSLSTVAIVEGLLLTADYSGVIHALDPETGAAYWTKKSGAHIWGSPLLADGKVYLGTEEGELLILAASREYKELARVNLGAPIYSTPVAANGVLYVATTTQLYAIASPK